MRRFWSIVDERVIEPGDRGIAVSGAVAFGAILATWAAGSILGVNLPFLFCIGAVLVGAVRGGFLAATFAAIISLMGTTLLAGRDHTLVNQRSLIVVATFCLALAVCGEVLRRLRWREREATIQALRREQTLQVMFDGSPAVTLVVDRSGRIVALNDAAVRLLGMPRDRLLGQAVGAFLPHSMNLPGPQPVILPDGRNLQVRVWEAALPIGGRQFRMVYIRDETEAVRAANTLAVTQGELHRIARATALGQFGSSIAHELNQPLAFIANYAGAARALLAQKPARPVEAAQALDDALGQIFRASAVLKKLRAFVGRSPAVLAWQPATAVLDDAIALGGMAVREAGALLMTDIEAGSAEVLIDAVQFQQVIVNLLLNAADAARDADLPRVLVRAWSDDAAELVISIEDSGAGVPASVAQDVFAPFQSTKPDGVGIGLAICRTIVEAHGGRIWCDTGSTLGGARFSFTLQRRDAGAISDAA